MTLTDEQIAELRALLAKMTAPSWEVFVREHPCRFGRNHRENWIVTAWSHGQLKGPVPVAASKVGVGAEGGEPVHMVHINDDDAAGIVVLVNAAEPMLDEIERLRAEVARLREAIKVQASAVRTLQACEETEINRLRKERRGWHEAMSSLDSEREANAVLTAENERLREALRILTPACCLGCLDVPCPYPNEPASHKDTACCIARRAALGEQP